MAQGVFFNIPFHGHINPTLPLIAELTRRGDHITYYSSEAFRPVIEQAGATFRGIDAFFTERTPVDANLVRFAYTLIHATQRMLPGLLAETRANPPDYILFDTLCIWGKCVAEILRIPAVASISTIARPHEPMRREIAMAMLPMLPSSVRMLVEGGGNCANSTRSLGSCARHITSPKWELPTPITTSPTSTLSTRSKICKPGPTPSMSDSSSSGRSSMTPPK